MPAKQMSLAASVMALEHASPSVRLCVCVLRNSLHRSGVKSVFSCSFVAVGFVRFYSIIYLAHAQTFAGNNKA